MTTVQFIGCLFKSTTTFCTEFLGWQGRITSAMNLATFSKKNVLDELGKQHQIICMVFLNSIIKTHLD